MLKIVCWGVESIESKTFDMRSFFDEKIGKLRFSEKCIEND